MGALQLFPDKDISNNISDIDGKGPSNLIPFVPNTDGTINKVKGDLQTILSQSYGKYIMRSWTTEELESLLRKENVKETNVPYTKVLSQLINEFKTHQEGDDREKTKKALKKVNELIKVYYKTAVASNTDMAFQAAMNELPVYMYKKRETEDDTIFVVKYLPNLLGKLFQLALQLDLKEGFVIKSNEPLWSAAKVESELVELLKYEERKPIFAGNPTNDELEAYITYKKTMQANK